MSTPWALAIASHLAGQPLSWLDPPLWAMTNNFENSIIWGEIHQP